jgi:hypothetical protein
MKTALTFASMSCPLIYLFSPVAFAQEEPSVNKTWGHGFGATLVSKVEPRYSEEARKVK